MYMFVFVDSTGDFKTDVNDYGNIKSIPTTHRCNTIHELLKTYDPVQNKDGNIHYQS